MVAFIGIFLLHINSCAATKNDNFQPCSPTFPWVNIIQLCDAFTATTTPLFNMTLSLHFHFILHFQFMETNHTNILQQLILGANTQIQIKTQNTLKTTQLHRGAQYQSQKTHLNHHTLSCI